jgi:hypothetical protein
MALDLETVLTRSGINPVDFTPGEIDAIRNEAVARIAKGGDESLAVAGAVHQCAPTKSRADAFTGGSYLWSRNSDGTFNLFDVPVFAKHVRKLGMKLVASKDGTPRVEENVVTIDETWLARAIATNQGRLEQGKYAGSLHVRHHPQHSGEQDRTEPAGKFVLKYVKPMLYEGEMVPVLYADFVKIPGTIFERIKAGLLPYRSIESLPPKFEEIDSIALLDTETPWFRLPMLTPGEEIQREVYAATCSPLGSPLRGVAKLGGNSTATLCYFAGGDYAEKKDDLKKDKKETPPGTGGDGEESDEDVEKGDEQKAEICGMCGLSHPEDGRHEEDEDTRNELSAGGEGDIMGKILDTLTALAKSVEALGLQVGVKPPPPAGKDAPVVEADSKPSTIQSKAESEGRLAAVEQVLNDLKRNDSLKALVAKAMTDLCEYNLGAQAGEKLLAKAVSSKEAEKCVADYVEAVKEHGTKMPAHYAGGRGQSFVPPPAADLPEAVREYSARGADVLEKAIKAHETFLLCQEQGSLRGGMTEKEFIKHRIEPGYGAALKG